MMVENASHLHSAHALNQMVTTMTASARLTSVWDGEVPEGSVLRAATRLLDMEGYQPSKSSRSSTKFKNCCIVRLCQKSNRVTDSNDKKKGVRWVAVKIFRNMSLHITGAYCIEMLMDTINKIAEDLGSFMQIELEMEQCSLTMVNYGYSLPGEVNLHRLTQDLSENGMLVIFDPSKYAGVNVKHRLDDAECSILIFEPGKLIISTPRCDNRDALLFKIIEFVEKKIVQGWDKYSLKVSRKRKKAPA